MHSSDTKGETAMKKEYKDLELEIVRFDAEDVITASGGCRAHEEPCEYGVLCGCDEPVSCRCVGVQM